jgi:hypothetical protein
LVDDTRATPAAFCAAVSAWRTTPTRKPARSRRLLRSTHLLRGNPTRSRIGSFRRLLAQLSHARRIGISSTHCSRCTPAITLYVTNVCLTLSGKRLTLQCGRLTGGCLLQAQQSALIGLQVS